MRVVDREVARAPQDVDVRAWRARVLAWSGRMAEAEKEYLAILKVSRNDPDNWMGLASVYSREGKQNRRCGRSTPPWSSIQNALTFTPRGRGHCAPRANEARPAANFGRLLLWTQPARRHARG